jgi:chorismate mutase
MVTNVRYHDTRGDNMTLGQDIQRWENELEQQDLEIRRKELELAWLRCRNTNAELLDLLDKRIALEKEIAQRRCQRDTKRQKS